MPLPPDGEADEAIAESLDELVTTPKSSTHSAGQWNYKKV